MYIQPIPHPLAHFNREFESGAALVIVPTTATNGTASSSVSHPTSHRIDYVVLAVILAVVLLSIVGSFVARRRVRSLLPCIASYRRRHMTRESAPHTQWGDHTRFTDEFNIIPSLNASKVSGSSRTPTSPSSEGPSTPVDGEDYGKSGIKSGPNTKDECSFVPIPIIVHSPKQTHQTTFFTGPDVSSPDFDMTTADHEQFCEEDSHMPAHGSAIRPHGLPLSPVPEESSGMVSFSSPHVEMDGEML